VGLFGELDNELMTGCCAWAEAQRNYYRFFDVVEVQ